VHEALAPPCLASAGEISWYYIFVIAHLLMLMGVTGKDLVPHVAKLALHTDTG
jgi:hypothetical protein